MNRAERELLSLRIGAVVTGSGLSDGPLRILSHEYPVTDLLVFSPDVWAQSFEL